jgi:Holliday junction resolvasome RuvABC endonuclease subunit
VTYLIGIDPGYSALGWAVVPVVGGTVTASGAISFSGKQKANEKLPLIVNEVRELFIRYDTELDYFAIESGGSARNLHTVRVLSELVGALLTAADDYGLVVSRVNPKEWQVAAGIPARAKRLAGKKASITSARFRVGNLDRAISDNEADAINLAVYAAGRVRMRMKGAA